MKILDKKEFHTISGGIYTCCSMHTLENTIIVILQSDYDNPEFQLDGLTFKKNGEGIEYGGIYNGYQVVFSQTKNSTTFVLTPVVKK